MNSSMPNEEKSQGGFLVGFQSTDEYTAFWTRTLCNRANRLRRLTDLKAPGLIVAEARRLTFEALMRLPLSAEDAVAAFNMNEHMRRDEQDHLHRTGYYDEAMKDLGLDDEGGGDELRA